MINHGELEIIDSAILYNWALDSQGGGGGIANFGTLIVTGGTVAGNRTQGIGGGVYNEGTATLANVGLDYNRSSLAGGGIYQSDGELTMFNVTVVSGHSSTIAGGIYHQAGSMSIVNSTLLENRANESVGGLFSAAGGIHLYQTVIVGSEVVNSTTPTIDVVGQFDATSSYNLIGVIDTATGLTDGENGNLVGTIAVPLDAGLGNEWSPVEGSPLIDAGDPSFNAIQFGDFLLTDHLGQPRVFDGDDSGAGRVDIGAVEFHLLDLTVTVFHDELDGDTSPEDLSLREVIILVNNNPSSSVIRLPAGVYTLSIEGTNEGLSRTGSLDIYTNWPVRIVGAGAGQSIIDGSGIDRVMTISGRARTVIEGVTIQGGRTIWWGGGIFLDEGHVDLTIIDSHLVDNEALDGGAIYAGEDNVVTITGSTFQRNIASRHGGAIYIDESDVTIDNSKIVDNMADGNGGGIFSDHPLFLTDTEIRGNTAGGNGGGLYIERDTTTIDSSVVSGNSSVGRGGGILVSRGTLIMSRSSVEHNVAGQSGGGLDFSGRSQGRIDQSTIALNQSSLSGGGIHLRGTYGPGSGSLNVDISSSTISGNHAAITGGGIHVSNDAAILSVFGTTITANTLPREGSYPGAGVAIDGSSATFHNSIIIHNIMQADTSPQLTRSDIGGNVRPESSYNLIGVMTPQEESIVGIQGNIVAGNRTINAGLGPLAYNGGPTKTHALLPDSPAIDAGDPNFDPGTFDPPLLTDQRGQPRLVDGDGDGTTRLDMGAVEFSPNFLFGDLNDDRQVDLIDLARIRRGFRSDAPVGYAEGDLTADGRVDRSDLAAVVRVFGTSIASSVGSPAPAAVVDQVIAGAGLVVVPQPMADRLTWGRQPTAVVRRSTMSNQMPVRDDRAAVDRLVFDAEKHFSIASRSHRGIRSMRRVTQTNRQDLQNRLGMNEASPD